MTMIDDGWINDGDWYCSQCDINFKVYTLDDEPVVNFCPTCASRNIKAVEEE
jgi:Zn finger protein HypA/HybF involved in hydrogenase expression